MMIKTDTGLSDSDYYVILRTIGSFKRIESVILFGSRAKGNYKEGSDVDLALSGGALSREDLVDFSYALNQETFLPYRFDVIDLADADKVVQEHIKRVGVVLYLSEKE